MTSLWYRDAGLRGREAFLALSTVIIYGLMGGVASAQTVFIPTLTVSETYDSNVFDTPKSTLPPGSKPEDYITTVTPMINVAHTGSLIRGNLSVGALLSRYIENTDLNYTGYNAAGRLDLSQLANKEVSRRITNLRRDRYISIYPDDESVWEHSWSIWRKLWNDPRIEPRSGPSQLTDLIRG